MDVILSSEHRMPLIGFGTLTMPLPPHDVLTSIHAKYRHIDTATQYGTEEPLGRSIAKAVKRGLIKSRDKIFITTKLWCTDAHPNLVVPAFKNSLNWLGLEYVDLYLVHWLVRLKEGTEGTNLKGKLLPFDMKGLREAMEECSKPGLAKSIGVSNLGTKKLSQLFLHATIPPVVNQVEMNVGWQQEKLREYCREKGIHVTAWSPLAANGAPWGSLAVMENPLLKEISIVKGKTVAQGLDKIKFQMPRRRGYPGDMFSFEDGPYKSLDELWNGDA
ncbi:hypothetical protein ACJRO7_029963 [Eucalyptus globulus]|uniref:NADP-dependent oxidoreductase domain-containing protein n=1 Tax=Eucalyptus globulus TaxID=34317 RepID=A0ABD3JC30_EUCGL